MPSSSDQLRLVQLIGARDEDNDFSVAEGSNIKSHGGNKSREKKNAKVSGKLRWKGSASKESSQKITGKKYADQPVSFVSCGVMQPGAVEVTANDDVNDVDKIKDMVAASEMIEMTAIDVKNMDINRENISAFEVHTKGFGSNMMAKMGFVEGGGLGKDGQGMSHPIEVTKRPKSLGLGVEFSEASTSAGDNQTSRGSASRTAGALGKCKKVGTFEEHTKGFGLKMMAKMGFVEGMGLEKDSQGMVNPLLTVRQPKARGLGAKGY